DSALVSYRQAHAVLERDVANIVRLVEALNFTAEHVAFLPGLLLTTFHFVRFPEPLRLLQLLGMDRIGRPAEKQADHDQQKSQSPAQPNRRRRRGCGRRGHAGTPLSCLAVKTTSL